MIGCIARYVSAWEVNINYTNLSSYIPDLSGKTIWLIGASGGLGPGIARKLALSGSELALHYFTHRDRAQNLAEELSRQGAKVMLTNGDLSASGIAEKSVNRISHSLSEPQILVYAAGTFKRAPFIDHSSEQFHHILSSNLVGFFEAAKAVIPGMRRSGWGRIIALGMAGAQYTTPMRFFGAHLAAKSAVVALARTLALEEAPYVITVNVVNPGHIKRKELTREQAREIRESSAFPLGYPGSYEDIADAILFLLSEHASYITGAVIDVTGGWTSDREAQD